jgi:FMN phosphatase YigB (HAD superfamily)
MSSLSRFRLITFDVTDTLIKFRTAPGKQYGEIGALFGVHSDDHHDLVSSFKFNW